MGCIVSGMLHCVQVGACSSCNRYPHVRQVWPMRRCAIMSSLHTGLKKDCHACSVGLPFHILLVSVFVRILIGTLGVTVPSHVGCCYGIHFQGVKLSTYMLIGTGIAQWYSTGLDDLGFESRQELGISLFITVSRLALGPTHLHLVLKSKMCGAIPPIPKYAFMSWCSIKAQGQLYLYLTSSLVNMWDGR
jgi:hypothetical protein